MRLIVGALVVPSDAHKEGKGVKVGIVFDIGGKNDKSFNEAAWRGLQRAEAELGIQGTFIELTEGTDRESALRTLASRRYHGDRRWVHFRSRHEGRTS